MCMCKYVFVCMQVCQDSHTAIKGHLVGVGSLYHLGLEVRTQVTRFGSKFLNLLSYLSGPRTFLF